MYQTLTILLLTSHWLVRHVEMLSTSDWFVYYIGLFHFDTQTLTWTTATKVYKSPRFCGCHYSLIFTSSCWEKAGLMLWPSGVLSPLEATIARLTPIVACEEAFYISILCKTCLLLPKWHSRDFRQFMPSSEGFKCRRVVNKKTGQSSWSRLWADSHFVCDTGIFVKNVRHPADIVHNLVTWPKRVWQLVCKPVRYGSRRE